MIAYLVMPWNLGAVASYLIIVPTPVAATFPLYEVAVRRTGLTRFLFGVKSPRKSRQPRVGRGAPVVGVR